MDDRETEMHTTADSSALLAATRVRDLHETARQDGLARLAARCCPPALVRAGQAVLAWLRRGQLGPGYVVCC